MRWIFSSIRCLFLDEISGLECVQSGSKLDKDECLRVEGLTTPDQSQSCTVDCSREGTSPDCVFGPWSSWTECTAGCPSNRTRRRQASCTTSAHTLITSSVREKDAIESEPCPCNQYRSVPNGGHWSQCILDATSKSSKFCGVGKRFRRLDCLDSNNQIVDIK